MVARYDVEASSGGGELQVTMTLPPRAPTRFGIERGAGSFVRELSIDGTPTPVRFVESEIQLERCASGCVVKYVFDLRGAAEFFDDVGAAARRGEAFLAPASTWLLAPTDVPATARFSLDVRGAPFKTGMPRGAGGRTEASWDDLDQAPYSLIGASRAHVVEVGDAKIEVALLGTTPRLGDERLLRWISDASEDVASYLGEFPVEHALVVATVGGGRGVSHGTTMGNGGASIVVDVGELTNERKLSDDWIMTHEMFHIAFPGLVRRHSWAEEGMATYLEPIARAARGRRDVDEVWREWIEAMPQGLPVRGDRGLDETPTWGRIYWGGAIFWLLADVEARELTDNRKSIRDVFVALKKEGGNVSERWTMTKVIEVGDRAIGHPVLEELYEKHGLATRPIDLEALFQSLGVGIREGAIEYDETARLAAIRRDMVRGPRKAP